MVTAKDVPPGGVGEVKATYKSKGSSGSVSKTISVETNDPKNRAVKLILKGKVVADVTVDPRFLNFGEVLKDKPRETKILRIDLREGKDLRIEDVRSENPQIVVGKTKQDDRGAEYSVALAEDVPVGRIAGEYVVVRTNSKKNPEVRVAVHAFVPGNVNVSPQVISLGIVTPGETVTRQVTLSRRGDKAFSVKEAKASSDRLTTEVKKEKDGEIYKVDIRYNPGDLEEGRIAEKVTIVIQDGEQETMQIPIHGLIRPKPQAKGK